jgi:hypothetical protein
MASDEEHTGPGREPTPLFYSTGPDCIFSALQALTTTGLFSGGVVAAVGSVMAGLMPAVITLAFSSTTKAGPLPNMLVTFVNFPGMFLSLTPVALVAMLTLSSPYCLMDRSALKRSCAGIQCGTCNKFLQKISSRSTKQVSHYRNEIDQHHG